jgi:hypothetical protein
VSAPERKSSFVRESGFALVVSAIAAVVATTLSLALPTVTAIRIVVAGIGLVYVLRVLAHSSERTGRIVVTGLWLVAAFAAWFLAPGLAGYVALHAGLVWLARSLYLHRNLLEAACDLGLSGLAICFGTWAAIRTESLFLAIWCFLLITAMHGAIPGLSRKLARPRIESGDRDGTDRTFADALAAAEEAIRRLATGN